MIQILNDFFFGGGGGEVGISHRNYIKILYLLWSIEFICSWSPVSLFVQWLSVTKVNGQTSYKW